MVDSQDATGNAQYVDTSASQGSTKRGGVGAEQRHRRQLRRTASRTKQGEGASGSTTVVVKPKADSKIEQKSLNKIMHKAILKTHSDDARPFLDGVGHSADQGIEPRSGPHAETDADLRGKGAVRGVRTYSIPTIRLGIPGPDRFSSAEEQHSGHANSTGPVDLLGPSGTPSVKPNLRRGPILQAGQDVQSRRQENHAEHRVTRETTALFRSTRSNRGRAQVRTGTTHGHGTRAVDVSVRSAEDVKIMVNNVWQSLTHSDQIERESAAQRSGTTV